MPVPSYVDARLIADRRTAFFISPEDGLHGGMAIDRDGTLWLALWGGWAAGY